MTEQFKPPESNMSSLEREFSAENFREYGKMCTEVAWKLTEAIIDKKFEMTILLPSRGALPIFMGAMLALERDKSLKELQMAQKINLPPLSCFDYVRKTIKHTSNGTGKIDVLIFPFTADVNLESRVEDKEEARKIIDDMRRFGSRAVVDFFKPPEKRDSFEFKLFLAFLEVVEKAKDTVSFYKELTQVKNLLMIDTVISGRASFSVLDEFEKGGIKIGEEGNLRPILVIDKEGALLKSNFSRFIYNNPRQRIDVPRILSEDRGAALEGVVAVIYPDLIIAACKEKLYQDCYPLFGNWHEVPAKVAAKYAGVFNSFLKTIDAIVSGKDFTEERNEFCGLLKESGILRGKDAMIEVGTLRIQGAESIEETSSHVVQVGFSKQRCVEIINQISRKMKT